MMKNMDNEFLNLKTRPSSYLARNVTDFDSSKNECFEGVHFILELYNCNKSYLNDEDYLKNLLTAASNKSGATLIKLATHKFNPYGVTAIALLAESHISIHTWPQIGYAAVDIFTCGSHTVPQKASDLFVSGLEAKEVDLKKISRNSRKNNITP